jgi:elongation of very long chain fatty acids protein 6
MGLHRLVKDPNGFVHHWVFDFELAFNDQIYSSIKRFLYNWWWLSILYALFYIIAVFVGRIWMARKQEKFELRQPLVLWNTVLTIFSFWGACRCVPEFVHALTQHGFMYSICDSSYGQGVTGLW